MHSLNRKRRFASSHLAPLGLVASRLALPCAAFARVLFENLLEFIHRFGSKERRCDFLPFDEKKGRSRSSDRSSSWKMHPQQTWRGLVGGGVRRRRKRRRGGFFVLRAEKVGDGFVLRAENVEDGPHLRGSPPIFVLRSRKIEEPSPIFEEVPHLRRSDTPPIFGPIFGPFFGAGDRRWLRSSGLEGGRWLRSSGRQGGRWAPSSKKFPPIFVLRSEGWVEDRHGPRGAFENRHGPRGAFDTGDRRSEFIRRTSNLRRRPVFIYIF